MKDLREIQTSIKKMLSNFLVSFRGEKGVSHLVQTLSLIVQIGVLAIAYNGLNIWQEEVRGLDKYNTARDGLVAIYRLRDELATVKTSGSLIDVTVLRGGVMFSSEGEGKFKDKGHWTDSVFKLRLEGLRKALDDYYDLIPRMEVIVGDEATAYLNRLNFPAEYYYNLGYDMYELGCHPFSIEVQADPEKDISEECVSLEKEFQDDEFLELFIQKFDYVNLTLRSILSE